MKADQLSRNGERLARRGMIRWGLAGSLAAATGGPAAACGLFGQAAADRRLKPQPAARFHEVSVPADSRRPPPQETPPAVTAPGLWWFGRRGRAAAAGTPSGPGIWRRPRPRGDWQWSPLPPAAVRERVYTGTGTPPPPAWPQDATIVQVERVLRPDGRELGYWVWNPTVFVELHSGSHQWSPRWQWAPAGRPLLLFPAAL